MNSTKAHLEDLIEKTTRWLSAIEADDTEALEVIGSVCDRAWTRWKVAHSEEQASMQDSEEREQVKKLVLKLRTLTRLCEKRAQEKQNESAATLERAHSARRVLQSLEATSVSGVSSLDQNA